MRVCAALWPLAALAYLVPSPSGAALSREQSARVAGGCTVSNYSACAQKVTGSEECSMCVGRAWQCDNSHSGYRCTSFTGTPCKSCGTCSQDCGGTMRKYGEFTDCTGTFTTDSCTNQWTDAQESTCSNNCAGG